MSRTDRVTTPSETMPDRHLAQHPVLGEPAAGRLEPDQPVDGRRDPDRAAAVVGVRERDRAGRHQRRRTGRRGAGGVLGRPRRADGAQPGESHRLGEDGHDVIARYRAIERAATKATAAQLAALDAAQPARRPPPPEAAGGRARARDTVPR